MRYPKRFSLLFFFLIISAILFVKIYLQKKSVTYQYVVDFVFDGDSFRLNNEQQVRLLGIDAPEKEDFFADKSRQFLKNLIEKKTIYLKMRKEEKDKYGRLLAYVFLSSNSTSIEESVNYKMIRDGYAMVSLFRDSDEYVDKFIEAQRNAIYENKNLWSDKENGPLKEEANAEYVTSETGHKFHKVGCEFGEKIVKKKILKSKREAFLEGKAPCKRCFLKDIDFK